MVNYYEDKAKKVFKVMHIWVSGLPLGRVCQFGERDTTSMAEGQCSRYPVLYTEMVVERESKILKIPREIEHFSLC